MASNPNYNFGIADDGLEKVYAPLASDNLRIEYVGKAQPGSLTSMPFWQIQKWTYDSNGFLTNIKYAQGQGDFNFVWDNRTGYF